MIKIDELGKIINYDIVDTIINSKIKMSYEKVNDIFENNIIPDNYKPYIEDLK